MSADPNPVQTIELPANPVRRVGDTVELREPRVFRPGPLRIHSIYCACDECAPRPSLFTVTRVIDKRTVEAIGHLK